LHRTLYSRSTALDSQREAILSELARIRSAELQAGVPPISSVDALKAAAQAAELSPDERQALMDIAMQVDPAIDAKGYGIAAVNPSLAALPRSTVSASITAGDTGAARALPQADLPTVPRGPAPVTGADAIVTANPGSVLPSTNDPATTVTPE
jgi:hypothetical protein